MKYLTVLAICVGGCSQPCPPVSAINGVVYSGFANIVEQEGQINPLHSTPFNGPLDISFQWGEALNGPMAITLNGQSFSGDGQADPVECGNFYASFTGEYLGDQGTKHNFSSNALFKFYETELDAEVSYSETWQESTEVNLPEGAESIGTLEISLGLFQGTAAAVAPAGTSPPQ